MVSIYICTTKKPEYFLNYKGQKVEEGFSTGFYVYNSFLALEEANKIVDGGVMCFEASSKNVCGFVTRSFLL